MHRPAIFAVALFAASPAAGLTLGEFLDLCTPEDCEKAFGAAVRKEQALCRASRIAGNPVGAGEDADSETLLSLARMLPDSDPILYEDAIEALQRMTRKLWPCQ